MLHSSAIRAILYTYLSSLEEDLREVVKEQVFPEYGDASFLSEVRLTELNAQGVDIDDISSILFELDFAEPWEIISANLTVVDEVLAKIIKQNLKNVGNFTRLRNQVAHTRPIEPDLMNEFLGMVDSIANLGPSSILPNLKKNYQQFQIDPGAALNVEIGFEKVSDRIPHNLPVPDFDETGLIGRETDLNELENLIRGPWPIITIVGEGAIGKTALAVRLAYKILDQTDIDFDSIIWVSAKSNQLREKEIKELNNEIKSSLDVLSSINEHLGIPDSENTDNYTELLNYFNEFKILLIIDNLETIIDDKLRELFSRFNSRNSKILTTSRIGLGDFERRYVIDHLNERDAVTLLRSLAKARNVQHLVQCSNQQLVKYCSRLLFSPGFIKWYVSTVQLGASPEQTIANPKLFLDFALENVFTYLSEESKKTIRLLGSTGGEKTLAEISYLCEIEGDNLNRIVLELCSANLLSHSTSHNQSSGNIIGCYQVSPLARFYIANKLKLDADTSKILHRRASEIALEKDLVLAGDRQGQSQKYLKETISYRSRDDAITGKLLKEALYLSRNNEYQKALEKIEVSRQLSPDFSEVFRIAGTIQYFAGNYFEANQEYQTALEMKPDDPVLLYWYAGFLLRGEQDTNAAIQTLEKAKSFDPNSVPIDVELSRAYTFVKRFDESHELLVPILEDDETSVKYARICADGFVQNFIRKINYLVDSSLGREALNVYLESSEKLKTLPKRSYDKKVEERIKELISKSFIIENLVFTEKNLESLKDAKLAITNLIKENTVYKSLDLEKRIVQNDHYTTQDSPASLTGVCKVVKYEKDYGFIHCEELNKDFHFKVPKSMVIKPGNLVEFEIITFADGRESAKIKLVKDEFSEHENAKLRISSYSRNDGFIEFYSEQYGTITSNSNEFELLGIEVEEMLGEDVVGKIFKLPKLERNQVGDIRVSENQYEKYSIFSKVDPQTVYSGMVTKIHKGKGGSIYLSELSKTLNFTSKHLKKPFSIYALEDSMEVESKVYNEQGRLNLQEVVPKGVNLPDITQGNFDAFVKDINQKERSFGFLTVENKWDVLFTRQHLLDESLWENLKNFDEVTCRLEDGEKEDTFSPSQICK